MSVFALKILAMVSMVCDHLGWWLYMMGFTGGLAYTLMRAFGRMAFPIFAFLIVNGYGHTKDKKSYISRLTLFALISQIPYTLVFTAENYSAAAGALSIQLPGAGYILLCLVPGLLWFCFVRKELSALLVSAALFAGLMTVRLGDVYLLGPQLNVFYTLGISLAVMCVADMFIKHRDFTAGHFAAAAAALAALLLVWNKCDYGINGIVLMLALWFFRENRTQQLFMLVLWCALHYLAGASPILFFSFAALAALPIAKYRGELGKPLKTVFYLVYPLHLSVMGIIIIWQAYL